MPNPQEKEAARKNLERFDWSVDYVLTHDCSEKMKVFLSMGQQNNSLNRFLTEIEGKLQFRKWFFGFIIWTGKFRLGTAPYTAQSSGWIEFYRQTCGTLFQTGG